MTVPPLPASPCLRVKLDYQNADGFDAGSRFYLSYTGAAPTSGNCLTIGADIGTAWNTNLAPIVGSSWYLKEIDVLDIASYSGASGITTVDYNGGQDGSIITANAAVNIEYGISRRYRGGKPRMFLPPPTSGQLLDMAHWSTDYLAAAATAIDAFFAAVNAIDVGAVGTLDHVNLSYYSGFKNVTNSSGRERAVPQYRDLALLDPVISYAVKSVVGSQRRRRTATTA